MRRKDRIASCHQDRYIGQVHSLLAAVLTALFPQRCLGCRVATSLDQPFCPACQRFIHPIEPPFCSCCGVPFVTDVGPNHLCSHCQEQPPAFRQARSWAVYSGSSSTPHPLNEAIQQFKYQRRLSTGKALASLAATCCALEAERHDVIVPVPLHLDRLRWRGFNQSLLLARAIGQARRIPVDPFLLERIRPTTPQTQLKGKERRSNVRGAFRVSDAKRLAEKTVLLIDDVYTSGATTQECAHALRRSGAAAVDVFTLARAVFQ